MYMILQLFEERYQDDISMALTESGIENSIILSGESLVHKMAFNMPLFAGFRNSIDSDTAYSTIFMAVVEKEQVDFLLKELKLSGINFIEDNLGSIVLLPIEKIYQ